MSYTSAPDRPVSVARVSLLSACAFSALVWAAGSPGANAAVPKTFSSQTDLVSYLKSHMAKPGQLKPHTAEPALVLRQLAKFHPEIMRRLAAARSASGHIATGGGPVTIPYWTANVTSPLDHQNYTYSMVGSSPYAPTPSNTNVQYVPVLLRIHVGGFTLDPSQPTPSYGNPNPNITTCDSQSPGRRFFNSPIFRPVTNFNSNGVNVAGTPGGQQLISAFQRANFWQAVHGTNYGVTLTPTRLDPIVVDFTATDPNDSVLGVPDNCGGTAAVPLLSINEIDSELQAIGRTYATASQIPVTLVVDTAIYTYENPGYCCVLGYHSAVPVGSNGVQVYSIGAYFDTNGAFGPHFADTTIWAHELSELIDDPFVQFDRRRAGRYE